MSSCKGRGKSRGGRFPSSDLLATLGSPDEGADLDLILVRRLEVLDQLRALGKLVSRQTPRKVAYKTDVDSLHLDRPTGTCLRVKTKQLGGCWTWFLLNPSGLQKE